MSERKFKNEKNLKSGPKKTLKKPKFEQEPHTEKLPKTTLKQNSKYILTFNSKPPFLTSINLQIKGHQLSNIYQDVQLKNSHCQVTVSLAQPIKQKKHLENRRKIVLTCDTREEPNRFDFVSLETTTKNKNKKTDQNKNEISVQNQKNTKNEKKCLSKQPNVSFKNTLKKTSNLQNDGCITRHGILLSFYCTNLIYNIYQNSNDLEDIADQFNNQFSEYLDSYNILRTFPSAFRHHYILQDGELIVKKDRMKSYEKLV